MNLRAQVLTIWQFIHSKTQNLGFAKHADTTSIFVYFPSLSRRHFITSVTLVTAKNQHRCWKARATRTREEFFFCIFGFWGSWHSQTFTRPFFKLLHFRPFPIFHLLLLSPNRSLYHYTPKWLFM